MILIWDPQKVKLEVQKWHMQYYHIVIIVLATMKEFAVTFVYGQLTISNRKAMWDGMQQIASSMALLWLIMGYFNLPLMPEGKHGGSMMTCVLASYFTLELDILKLFICLNLSS